MRGRHLVSSALLLLLIALVGVPAAPSLAQEALTEISLIQNGGFESGLSGWQRIDSGLGRLDVSRVTAHSGSSSFLTILRPTSAIYAADVQGVFQNASVRELRDLDAAVWVLTAPCPLPAGTFARLIIQVDQLAIHYDTQGTCGNWQRINPSVKADFQSVFGSAGLQPFQQNSKVSITITLEILRFGNNYVAMREYVSAYWDDVEMSASIPAQTATIATAVANTSITFDNSTSTAATTSSAAQLAVTLTQVSTETRYLLGSPEQFMISALVLASAFSFLLALLMRRNIKNRRAGAKLICPKCEAAIPDDPEARFCPECGSDLVQPDFSRRTT